MTKTLFYMCQLTVKTCRYFSELVKNSCIPWSTVASGRQVHMWYHLMNICSPCSGDFAFTKHLFVILMESLNQPFLLPVVQENKMLAAVS